MKDYQGNQFGYIWAFNKYWTTDPIGKVIINTENTIYKNKSPMFYKHEVWVKWDRWYRCSLKIPYIINKFEQKRHE